MSTTVTLSYTWRIVVVVCSLCRRCWQNTKNATTLPVMPSITMGVVSQTSTMCRCSSCTPGSRTDFVVQVPLTADTFIVAILKTPYYDFVPVFTKSSSQQGQTLPKTVSWQFHSPASSTLCVLISSRRRRRSLDPSFPFVYVFVQFRARRQTNDDAI